MREEYLHFIWRFKRFNHQDLITSTGEKVEIVHPGYLNHHGGPDFSQAHLIIDGIQWHGPVEIHIQSTDWTKHKHNFDVAYDHVALHVVFENDGDVKTSKGRILPVFELKDRIDEAHLKSFQNQLPVHLPIPCGVHLNQIDDFMIRSWVHRMAIDRLEEKWEAFNVILESTNDWSQASWVWLARSFGFGINGNAFQHLAERIDWKFFIKFRGNYRKLLALILGQGGWLGEHGRMGHPILDKEYFALQKMYQLHPISSTHWNYGKVFPANQPHRRAVQLLAVVVSANWGLSKLDVTIDLEDLKTLIVGDQEIIAVANQIYGTQFSALAEESIRGVLTNAIFPLIWFRAKWLKKQELSESAIDHYQQLPPEMNKTIKTWKAWGVEPVDRLESQGLLQLYRTLCSRKKCLSCLIGLQTLKPSHNRHETNL
jgi:hypothetical protein